MPRRRHRLPVVSPKTASFLFCRLPVGLGQNISSAAVKKRRLCDPTPDTKPASAGWFLAMVA